MPCIVRKLESLPLGRAPDGSSGGSSVINILLHLYGLKVSSLSTEALVPSLSPSADEPPLKDEDWTSSIDRSFESMVLRRMHGDTAASRQLIVTELIAGRPVGLLLRHQGVSSSSTHGDVWVAIRINEIDRYAFLDVVRYHPDSHDQNSQFTEKGVLRLDALPPDTLADVIYCEELVPRLPARPGRPRKIRKLA